MATVEQVYPVSVNPMDSRKRKDSREAMTDLHMEVETTNPCIPKPQFMYRCKKCRRIVAIEENIVPHEPGKGEECFAWKKRSGNSEQVQCSSIFVEPMKWMQTIHDGSVEEKLLCLGCNARLGYFNWAGMQCSCGAWVNPAFQLQKSRIDECKSDPNPNLNPESV
uniref:Putative inactive dual specificity protein phosphatase-like n=1 Tax=Noccaea caerulescens TaxID=107243 RepID=A0A1J3DZ87_NOCCA